MKEFKIIGRRVPTAKVQKPPLFRMRIFAPDVVSAKSRFWYFMALHKKLKKTVGEIVACSQITEKNPSSVKNFGIWIRYNSRSGTHNMYREYRDVTVCGAVTQCYRDMAARHRARASSIQILKIETVESSKVRRPHVKQMINSKLRFPLPHRQPTVSTSPSQSTTVPSRTITPGSPTMSTQITIPRHPTMLANQSNTSDKNVIGTTTSSRVAMPITTMDTDTRDVKSPRGTGWKCH